MAVITKYPKVVFFISNWPTRYSFILYDCAFNYMYLEFSLNGNKNGRDNLFIIVNSSFVHKLQHYDRLFFRIQHTLEGNYQPSDYVHVHLQ